MIGARFITNTWLIVPFSHLIVSLTSGVSFGGFFWTFSFGWPMVHREIGRRRAIQTGSSFLILKLGS